jgi:dTDP-4-amino-4,6-dideoxygalactose transaminase
MIVNRIDQYILRPSQTLREALERLQATGKGAVLLTSEKHTLLRVVTDGDVRRMLLAGHGLSARLADLSPQVPRILPAGTSPDEALAFMNEQKIDHVPIVDPAGHPLQLFFRRDVDTTVLLSTPHIGVEEMKFVEEAFRSNWIAPLGPNVEAFEREVAAYVGAKDAAAVSSGTAAIHLGLHLLDVKAGDTVFCSSLTFVASINPALYLGATPVFIDSEPLTWNMSPEALSRALHDAKARARLPKAVIVVNLYGQSADYEPIVELCRQYGVPILEDAAESLGATYDGRHSGTIGRIGVFSFNGNKIITTSGGGMLVSDDKALIARARHLSTQAREPAPYYQHTEVGFNYRMSNVLAGIGRGQLKLLDERVAARRAIFHRYVEALQDVADLEWMPESNKGLSTHWLSACTVRGGRSVSEIIDRLAAERIEARHVWKPMHLQPLFSDALFYPHRDGEDVSGDLFGRGLCLPSGSNMTTAQQDRIIEALRRSLTD